MEKNSDYNYYSMPPFGGIPFPNGNSFANNTPAGMYDVPQADFSPQMESNAMFNPMLQYEQAYMYYRYLAMQMDYKIKCKEYEKMSSKPEYNRDSGRKIE